ncbi:MAG TPA: hypothetical protein VIS73_08995 [Rhodocyclaceae bacterium]
MDIATQVLLIKLVRALVEVAGFCLLGQGAVAIFAGPRRESNPIYQLFRVVTRPVIALLRAITPKFIIDRHLPYLAFFILFWAWILLALLRVSICRANGLTC